MIKAKEMYEGALAASHAQAERERAGAPEPTMPMQVALGPSNRITPSPIGEVGSSMSSQVGRTLG
jgi:hypothetical protein